MIGVIFQQRGAFRSERAVDTDFDRADRKAVSKGPIVAPSLIRRDARARSTNCFVEANLQLLLAIQLFKTLDLVIVDAGVLYLSPSEPRLRRRQSRAASASTDRPGGT